jgi:hypothetical protein
LPVALPLQDRIEVPEALGMLVVESVHERFVELVATESATVPVKPFRGATVTVEVPAAPLLTMTLV